MGAGSAIKSAALAFICLGAVIDHVLSYNDKNVASPRRTSERAAIALLTVPLRGGGLRKCTGAAIGVRDVLVAANCLAEQDESKFIQVQVLSSSAVQQEQWAPGKPQKDKERKKVESGGPYAKKNKYPKSEQALQTRFSKTSVKLAQESSGGTTLALLKLTAPLDKEAWLPLAADPTLVYGNAPCRLYAWGGTKELIPEARLAEVEALAGNWTSCWHRVGNAGGYGGGGANNNNVRADRRLCAQTLGCLPPSTGAALVCGGPRGALTALLAPAPTLAKTLTGALNALGKQQCTAGALQLNAVSPMIPYIRAAVPQVTLAPSGLRPNGQVLPGLGAGTALLLDRHRTRRRPRSLRHPKRAQKQKKARH